MLPCDFELSHNCCGRTLCAPTQVLAYFSIGNSYRNSNISLRKKLLHFYKKHAGGQIGGAAQRHFGAQPVGGRRRCARYCAQP